VERHSVVNPQV